MLIWSSLNNTDSFLYRIEEIGIISKIFNGLLIKIRDVSKLRKIRFSVYSAGSRSGGPSRQKWAFPKSSFTPQREKFGFVKRLFTGWMRNVPHISNVVIDCSQEEPNPVICYNFASVFDSGPFELSKIRADDK